MVTCAVLLYTYCLLGFQTQQTHHEVVRLNLERSQEDWMEAFYQVQAREFIQQRRNESKSNQLTRVELKRLKVQQQEALKLYKFNRTSVNLDMDNIVVNKTATDSKDEANERAANAGNNLFDFLFLYLMIRLASRRMAGGRQAAPGQPLQGPANATARRRQITPQQQIINNRRFRQWANELNRQREAQGERPLSLDALRLVLRERQVSDGNDYEGLLEFQEQSGPAMEALLRSLGATDAQIERLPSRVLGPSDDLLQPSHGKLPDCAICLEHFASGESVRTIPCFHSFHKNCIDPWLANKAECPICKHSAIA
jgi:hypothetical protein